MSTGNDTEVAGAEIGDASIESGANRYLGKPFELLTERERAVFRRLISRHAIAHDSNQSFDSKLTSSQRLADKVSGIFVPIVIGLMLASGVVTAKATDDTWIEYGMTVVVAFLVWRTRLNPLWLLGGAAIVGLAGVATG